MCRTLGKIFAVLALGTGAGCLVWGIMSAALGEPIRTPLMFDLPITTSSEAIGAGAGLMVAGITSLILSLVGGRPKDGRKSGPGCCG
jgi:hypothetical protein